MQEPIGEDFAGADDIEDLEGLARWPGAMCGNHQVAMALWLNQIRAAQEQVGEGFARADNTALKKRKIFKARRGSQAPPAAPIAVGDATATGANPFAGISLMPAAHAAHPFAGVSLAAPEAPKVFLPCPEPDCMRRPQCDQDPGILAWQHPAACLKHGNCQHHVLVDAGSRASWRTERGCLRERRNT